MRLFFIWLNDSINSVHYVGVWHPFNLLWSNNNIVILHEFFNSRHICPFAPCFIYCFFNIYSIHLANNCITPQQKDNIGMVQ